MCYCSETLLSSIFVVSLLIGACTVQSALHSRGLLSFSNANDGDLHNTSYVVAAATFGYQSYIGNITGMLILPANESYNKQCNGGEPQGINPYIHYIQDWFIEHDDITDYILIIDRLDCYFTDKVSAAQSLGAKAAIICDHKMEALLNMNTPKDYAWNINIPSVLLQQIHCETLMNYIGVQNWNPQNPLNMTYPGAYSIKWTTATIEWGTPSPDGSVEWQLWTSSLIWDYKNGKMDYLSAIAFKRNFNSAAMALKNQTIFTPHFYVYNGTKNAEITTFGCQHADVPCGRRCSNNGRYCYPVLAESSGSIQFVDGMNVVQENLRSICVWEYTKKHFATDFSFWWRYDILWDENCGILSTSNYTSTFNQNCSFQQMDKLDPCGRLTTYVQDCINSSGGYGYLDGVNTLFRRELQFRDNSSIISADTYPAVVVNGWPFYFFAYRQDDILNVICDALQKQNKPYICFLTPSPTAHPTSTPTCNAIDKDCNNVCFGNSKIDSCDQCLLFSDPSWNNCLSPTNSPSNSPTPTPTLIPTLIPTPLTAFPTNDPSGNLTSAPIPTTEPTSFPTCLDMEKDCNDICFGNALFDACNQCLLISDPSRNACLSPTNSPTRRPTPGPTISPTDSPTATPTDHPSGFTSGPTTYAPTSSPTINPYMVDSCGQCLLATDPAWNACLVPTTSPSFEPTVFPTSEPSSIPTSMPTSNVPTTAKPTFNPTTRNPTTSNPTTSNPTTTTTTFNPTTTNPTTTTTTSNPTTSNPTTAIPTTAIQTTTNPTTSTPTTVMPTSSNQSTFEPTKAPITTDPTTSKPTAVQPTTANPTKVPIRKPTISPTTVYPTYNPTTYHPTTYKPTSNPTTETPTKSKPTTNIPTLLPSKLSPTTFTPVTSQPSTISPTSKSTTSSATATYSPTTDDAITSTAAVTNRPSQAPTRYRRLHFICHYYDNKEYITTYLSLLSYAKLLLDSIVYSIQSISLQPIYYDEVQNNPLASWGRGGIMDFVICNVFDINLFNSDVECPSYSIESDYYISIGIFRIVANNELNQYKEWLIDIMTNDEFKDKCNEYMNKKLNNVTSENRRTLMEYDSFAMIKVEVIDPLNDTISTTEEQDELENTDNNSDTVTMVVIIIVVLFIIVVMNGFAIYMKKLKQKNDKIKQNTEEEAEGNYHNANIEMNEQENNNEVEGIDNAITNNVENIEDNNDINDDDLDNLNANINYHYYDADIVDMVNETHNNGNKDQLITI